MDAVTICNLALTKIGAQTIISFQDGTTASRLCNLLYPPSVSEVLRYHDWTWAKTIAPLTATATQPANDWNYSYGLPSDFVRIIEVNDFGSAPTIEFEIIGNLLYCDQGSVTITYVRNVTDPNYFDALSTEAIATRLAQKLAKPLAGSENMEQRLGNEFKLMIQEAARIDTVNNYPRRKPPWVDSDLVKSRFTEYAA